MTAVSDDTAAGRAAVPAGAEPPEDDVVVLVGDQLLPEGVWLLVAGVEAAPGGVFTGVRLPAEEPRASGGDVVLRLAAGPGRLPGLPDGHVQVYAVMAGELVLVGEWGIAGAGDWSEVVRVTAAFTMGVLAEWKSAARTCARMRPSTWRRPPRQPPSACPHRSGPRRR